MADLVSQYFVMLVIVAMATFLAVLGYHTVRDAAAPQDGQN